MTTSTKPAAVKAAPRRRGRKSAVRSPVDQGSVPEAIAARIRERILRGELAPGTRIVEGSLSRELRVGQATVREALFLLERQRLVERVANLGTFVTELDIRDISNLMQIRAQLEVLAAALAARFIQPADLAALRALVVEMQAGAEAGDGHWTYMESDLAFHRLIWSLSGNPPLAAMLESIVMPLRTFVSGRIERSPAEAARRAAEHFAIVDALEDGPSRAWECMQAHISSYFNAYLQRELNLDIFNLWDSASVKNPLAPREAGGPDGQR